MRLVFDWLAHNTTKFSILVFYTADEWLTMAIGVSLKSMIPKV